MSYTETQVIHTLTQPPSPATFLLRGMDVEDKGLIMTLENRLNEPKKTINNNGSVRTSINSQQSCRLSPLSAWVLRALSYLQNAKGVFASFANDMNAWLQKKLANFLPICLCLSLTVLLVQGVLVFTLLTQSILPLGMWFLMTCISSMGAIFYYTAVNSDQDITAERPKFHCT